MRAAVLSTPGEVRVETVPRPEPGPGQVRFRVESCGVCASNLPMWQGKPWFTYPSEPGAPGHEATGCIDALGDGVNGLRVGQRVAALSYHSYAEWDVADAGAVIPLPPELEGIPFPGEPLGCAMNIFERAQIQAGMTVAIVGIGFLGAALVQLATAAGARVLAVARRPWARQLAGQLGAAEAIPWGEKHEMLARAQELTGGEGCPVVIEAVGKQEALDVAAEMTAVRGRLVLAGYHQDGLRQVNLQLWNWRGFDVINAHERDPQRYVDGVRAAMEAVRTGRLDPRPLCTHTYPLEELGRALEETQERPDGFLKALIQP